MTKAKASAIFSVLVAITLLTLEYGFAQSAIAIELITQAEANYPPADEIRGPIPGPIVEVMSPPGDIPQRSPVRLFLRFTPFGGAKIDPESIRLIYEKRPEVELTPRVRPYATVRGIDVPKARVPPGTHVIRVLVRDTEGRLGSSTFKFVVTQ
jgi:hypothetical protein